MHLQRTPLLDPITEDHNIETISRCSEEKYITLKQGRDLKRQYVFFKVRPRDGKLPIIDDLQSAWQEVVNQRRELRTAYVTAGTDTFQVILKVHVPVFGHVRYGDVDDVEAKAHQEGLPEFTADAPMHALHVFTSDSSDTILARLCYSGIDIDHSLVVDLQTHLARAYKSVTTAGHNGTIKGNGETPAGYTADRLKPAEPTILGTQSTNSSNEEQATSRYTNLTLPASLGRDLLLQCLTDGVSPLNILQALTLIVLSKFSNVEQPCCYYVLPEHETRGQRTSICTAAVTGEERIADVVTRLYEQTKQDVQKARQELDLAPDKGKQTCNTTVRWYDCGSVWGAQDSLMLEPVTSSDIVENVVDLTLAYTGDTLILHLRTSPSVEEYLATSISNMLTQSLDFILRHPSCTINDIPSCAPTDITVFQTWNNVELPVRRRCIHDLIQQQAHLRPDAPAIDAHDGYLTYSEIDSLTSQVASIFLTNYAFHAGERVLLIFPHSMWAIVAMLSVMKAGCTFIPLDERSPPDRILSVIEKAGARYIITAEEFLDRFTDLGIETIPLNPALLDKFTPSHTPSLKGVSPDSLAYIIFTSGSTGTPKGCSISHQAFCSSALTYGPILHLGPHSRVLHFASYAFDMSLIEVLVSLLCGSCVCIPSSEERMSDLGRAAARLRADWAILTPSLVSRLGLEAGRIKTIVLAGEPITADVVNEWADRVVLLGGYGPSEATPISAVVGPLTRGCNPVNLGHPVGNKSWVVDKSDHDRLMPVGAIGELVLEGPSLGMGYIGDEERTRQAFIENPAWTNIPRLATGEETRRMYKTGDLVIRHEDGTLEYIGRKDMQVKVRGQRLELGDIETHLKAIVGVELAVEAGTPLGCADDEKTLVAFLSLGDTVPTDLSSADDATQARLQTLLSDVEDKLSAKLASYMLPAAYLPLRTLPVTTSGKRDRRKLQAIIASLSKPSLLGWAAPKSSVRRPLVSDMEHRVARLWGKVLKMDGSELSPDDDFIKKGGDSLAAMKLANLCKEEGLGLSFRDVYLKSRLLGAHAEVAAGRRVT